MLACRLTRLRAGCLDCLVDHFRVTLGGNLFLRNGDRITDRAVLACRLARLRAGRGFGRVGHFGVSRRGDFFHTGEDRITDKALRTGSMTSLGAGGGLLSNIDRGMPSRADCFGFAFITNRAGVSLDTGIAAGRGSRNHALVPAVTLSRNFFLSNKHFVADRAMFAFGLAGCGAGSFNGFVNHLGMTRSRNNLGLCFFADRAGVGLDAGILTGRRGRDLALIPTVALGGNLFLRFDNRSADRAADAIRQTRFGAGRRLAHNGLLSVAGSRDHFLFNNDFVANRAMLTFGQSSLRAGWSLCCIDYFCVALGLNGFTLGVFLAADGADRITGVAVLGAGGILLVDHLGERMIVLPLSIKSGVLGQINSRTIRIGLASTIGRRIPVQEVVAFTGERVCVQCGIRLRIYGLWGHRAFDRVFCTAVSFKSNRQPDRLLAAPNAIDIVDNITSVCGRGFGVRAVGVVQLGRSNRDYYCLICVRIILIGFSFRTGRSLLNVLTGAVAGADVRTTRCGVDHAVCSYNAVHIHLGIDQVVIGAVVCLTRRIGHGLKLAGAPDEVVGVPLIAVIEIDILSVCNCQASALGNIDLNARQQSCILIDRHIAGLDIDSNVVGDRQYVAFRVDIHACKRQRQRIQCRFAVYRKYKTVCLFIVILSKATGFHFEHTGVANEINNSSICGAHCINAAINLFIGAGIQRQGNFDVLYEVLRKWEHLVVHFGRCAAAAEVCNLIEFVHPSAGFRQNRAAAGDKAPCIEIAAVLDRDGTIVRHFDVSIITNGTSLLATGSGKIPAAQTDRAIDGNGRAFAHRQCPEFLRRQSRPNYRRSIRIQRSCLIKGNQKCNSSRNGIGTADGAISSQGNLGLAVCLCIGNRIAQIVKRLSSGFKQGRRFTCKPRRDGALCFNVQRSIGRSADVLSLGHIIPAHELITIRRSRHYLISSHGALRVAIFLGNEFSVYCISTVFSRHESRSCIDISYQNHVGKGDRCGGAGTAGLDVDSCRSASSQLLGERTISSNGCSIDLNGAALCIDSIVEGQRRRRGLVVFDGQCGIMRCIAACSARAGGRTGNACTIGRPSIICVARKTQSNVLVSQACHSSTGCCKRCHGHIGQQCHDHAHTEHKRKESLPCAFHFFITFFL